MPNVSEAVTRCCAFSSTCVASAGAELVFFYDTPLQKWRRRHSIPEVCVILASRIVVLQLKARVRTKPRRRTVHVTMTPTATNRAPSPASWRPTTSASRYVRHSNVERDVTAARYNVMVASCRRTDIHVCLRVHVRS